MFGSKQRMPKRARYPLFLIGLAIIILGGIAANSRGAPVSTLGAIILVGFGFLVVSVAIR